MSVKTICCKCDKECEVISVEDYDIEEFWGAPVRRYYSDDVSDCCEAEIEELEDEVDD